MSGPEKYKRQSIGIHFETIEILRFTECQMQNLLVLFVFCMFLRAMFA